MKLVVFDMDGTLVDSRGLITQVMGVAFAGEGLPVPDPVAGRQVIGLSLDRALARLSGLTGDALERLVARYRSAYLEQVGDGVAREPLFDGAEAAVAALAAREDMLLGIATGKALRGVHRILSAHGLLERFVTLQTPDHNPSKPHPGMLERAMAETGVEAGQVVMVGDTSFDIDMARAAGVKSVGVDWGYHTRRTLVESGANVVIDTYAELVPAIDGLIGGPNA